MTDTVTRLADILKDKFKVEAELGADSSLTGLGLDSLDVINFLFTVEQETGVKIPDEALADGKLDTLADFAAYIERHRA
jgi:acyl carrier protein